MAASISAPDKGRNFLLIALMLAAVVAGIYLRLLNITSEPLWLDEAYSAYAAGKGFDFLWHVVPQYETHPPFYYSLLRVWTLIAGDSLIGLRALGVVCGLAAILAVGLAGHAIGRFMAVDQRRRNAMMALAVAGAALSPRLVEMTREVRPYPVLIMVYAFAVVAIFNTARNVTVGRGLNGRSYYVYLALLAMTLWLHNLGVLYAASLGLALIILCYRQNWTRRDYASFLIGHLIVLAAWLPALAILADQAPTWVGSTWLHFPPSHLERRIIMLFVVPEPASVAAGVFLLVLTSITLLRHRQGGRILAALMLLMLLPLGLSLAISAWISPVFILRTMTPLAIPSFLLLTIGITSAQRRVFLAAMLALMIIFVQMFSSELASRAYGAQQKWYAALTWLEPRFRPGDVVFAYPNEGALPFRYAVRDKLLAMPTRPIPTDIPTLDGGPGAWNPTGSRGVFSLPQPALESIARSPQTEAVPTIWLLRLGPWAYDKGDLFLKALSRDRVQVGQYRDGPIDIIGLRKQDLAPAVPAASDQTLAKH